MQPHPMFVNDYHFHSVLLHFHIDIVLRMEDYMTEVNNDDKYNGKSATREKKLCNFYTCLQQYCKTEKKTQIFRGNMCHWRNFCLDIELFLYSTPITLLFSFFSVYSTFFMFSDHYLFRCKLISRLPFSLLFLT